MSDEVEAFWKGSSEGEVKTLKMKFQSDNRADHFDLSFGEVVSKKNGVNSKCQGWEAFSYTSSQYSPK